MGDLIDRRGFQSFVFHCKRHRRIRRARFNKHHLDVGFCQGGFKDQVHTWTLSICKETNQILVGEVAAIHPAFMWPSGLAPMEYAG